MGPPEQTAAIGHGHDALGQVTNTSRKWDDTAPGEQSGFEFDGIREFAWTVSVNTIKSRCRCGTNAVSGIEGTATEIEFEV